MITETNQMGVPEVRNYSRQMIEGGTLVAYEVRDSGERGWHPVRLFVPDDTPPVEDPLRRHRVGNLVEAAVLGRYRR